MKRSLELVHPTRVEEPVDAYFEAARGAFSRNTERALRSDVQVFRTWCREQVRTAFPASAATVAAFIDEMGRIKTTATVRRYTSSIATVHKALRESNPLDSAAVRFALQRMHRRRGRRQAQVQGLTWPLRNRLIEATGDRLIDARDRALLAVGYDTLLRRAELVAVKVPDLLDEMDGTATVLVRSGKTDGEGRGSTAMSGAEALWGRESMGGMGHGPLMNTGGQRLDTEVGYGLPIGSRFVGTPRAGVRTSEYGRDYRIGYGMQVLEQGKLNLQLGVDAERRESPLFQMQEQEGGTDQRVLGRATVQW